MPTNYEELHERIILDAVIHVLGECEHNKETRKAFTSRKAWNDVHKTLHGFITNSMASRLKGESDVYVSDELRPQLLLLEIQLIHNDATPRHENMKVDEIRQHDFSALAKKILKNIDQRLDTEFGPRSVPREEPDWRQWIADSRGRRDKDQLGPPKRRG